MGRNEAMEKLKTIIDDAMGELKVLAAHPRCELASLQDS